MTEKMDCTQEEFRPKHQENYRAGREVLRARLPQLGEGRKRFRPPF